MKELQEIELKIKDENEDGVFAVSLVENGAIEEDYKVLLSKQEIQLKILNEEKRLVVGFALIPEKRIYRKVKDKEFNIFFTAETIHKTHEMFMKKMNLNKFTTEHNKEVTGVSVIESWIVEDPKNDKSNIYELGAKGGEWVLMSKIYNDEVWEQVKAGTFKGYSIEGMFDGFQDLDMKDEIPKITVESDESIKAIKEFLNTL
jgi:hypothetical protein